MAKAKESIKKAEKHLTSFGVFSVSKQQQEKIKPFSEAAEISEIYKTDTGNVKLSYKPHYDGATEYVVWIAPNGDDFDLSHKRETGKTIDESKLTFAEYLQKFPFENIESAPMYQETPRGNRNAAALSSFFDSQTKTNPKAVGLSERRIVALDDIEVSDLKSQSHRRERLLKDEKGEIEGLAQSIRTVGLQQAPLVRPLPNGKYRLIFGERRKIAAGIAGLKEIEVIVRDLTETEAAEIQLTENIQRVNLHPVDEAFTYQDLISKLKCDEAEVALRAGKDVGYVKNCLLLLKLDKQVMDLFEGEKMTFRHALEFAKYPQKDQKGLLEYCFHNFGYTSQSLNPYQNFVVNIERLHLLKLKEAPFSITSTELRKDGLTCTVCPQRTSAEPLLFGENFKDADRCLNRKCFGEKTQRHFELQVESVAAAKFGADKAKQKIKDVPLITTSYYVNEKEKPKTGKILNSENWKEIKTAKDECDYAETGVFFNGNRATQKQTICANKNCKKHWKNFSGGGSAAASTPEELEEKRMRKEEIFDILVGEKVRRRVLKKAAEKFDAENTIFEQEKFNPVVESLVDRLWDLQCHTDHHVAIIIRESLGIEKSALGVGHWQDNAAGYEKLTAEQKSRMLFLLTVAHKNTLFEGGSWRSQKDVRELAEKFGIDYQLLDAEERLANARMKDKDLFRDYLHLIEAGSRQQVIPRVYSTKYKSKE